MSLQDRTCVFLISDPKHWQSKYSNVSGMNKLVAGASGHIFRTSWDFQLLWRKCLWKRFPGFSSHQALGFLPLFSLPCGHWVIPCSVFHCAQIFMVFLRDIWDTCHLLFVKMVLHLKSDHWKESAGKKRSYPLPRLSGLSGNITFKNKVKYSQGTASHGTLWTTFLSSCLYVSFFLI